MGGRVYDPRLGRFLSPDPIISEPWSGQGWNLYSYVGNSPVSRTDPTGLCFTAGPHCPGARGGGGFTPVSPLLAGQHFFWRVRLVISVRWSWATFGLGISLWNHDRYPSYMVPTLSFHVSSRLASTPTSQAVSLGQEMSPADGGMSPPLPSWLMFTPGELASLGIGFIPVVGTAQSVFEVATGRDIITGEEVHRGVALIGVVPGGKAVGAVVARGIDELIPVARRLSAPKGILTKPTADNPALRRTLDALYQPTDKIAGGTAGAVRQELASGGLVGGKTHVLKAKERLTRLRSIMKEQQLSPTDRGTAERVIRDLQDALKTPRSYR